MSPYTVCPTRYRTWHFFNNSNTNEDIATKFEQEYVRCVRNEDECVSSAPNLLRHGAVVRQPAGFGSERDTLYKQHTRSHIALVLQLRFPWKELKNVHFKGLRRKRNTFVGNTTCSLQVTGSVVLPWNNLGSKFYVITWPKVDSSSNDMSNHFNSSVHLEQKYSNLLWNSGTYTPIYIAAYHIWQKSSSTLIWEPQNVIWSLLYPQEAIACPNLSHQHNLHIPPHFYNNHITVIILPAVQLIKFKTYKEKANLTFQINGILVACLQAKAN